MALRELTERELDLAGKDAVDPRQSSQARTDPGQPEGSRDEAALNDITRVTNEMVTLQRELAKRNAQLEALHERTQNRAAELELRVEERTIELGASRARFSTMLETTGMGMALVDRQGHLALANRALAEILEDSREGLRGRAFADLFFDPDGGSALQDRFSALVTGEISHFRLEGYCTHRNGDLAWVNMTVAAIWGRDARFETAIAMVEDITDKRQGQAALMQAERLTLAGKLAASLAHEINNPLQSIIGCVGLAEEAVEAGESPAEYLALARSELRRVAAMVARMRDLHRVPAAEGAHPVGVPNLLEQVLALCRRQCEEHSVHVTRRLDEDTPDVDAVSDQLRQVFLNMVLNAIEAMPDGGNLSVRSSRTTGPYGVLVTFADSGTGIHPDVLPHIFKAFYSTKPAGTGIGLAITRDIVERHGGHIHVESEVGAGTTFRIWLPASTADP
jgi:PAS domain S-box-containing protein